MKKKIEIEIEFDKNFVPPEKFNSISKECKKCPFYYLDCEGYDFCWLNNGNNNDCPIKGQF